VYLSGNAVHDRVLKAFYEGCNAPKELVEGWEYAPSEVAVIFGVHKSKVPISWPRGQIFQRQRAKNLDVVVLETGYINRGDGENHHYAAGFNGLNGRADFRNQGMPSDRLELLNVELKPWREKGEHIVLCGQVPWDASVDHTDHREWLASIASQLRGHTNREIRFRPHPKGPQFQIQGCTLSNAPITEDMKGAHAVVAFNSNSGVEAVIDGIPVFAFDKGSMALPVANTKAEEIESPAIPDRSQWLNNLAYAQWTLEELGSGRAWKHLFR
jgi:hypothetical protein